MSALQPLFVAATRISTHFYGIGFSAGMPLLCCPGQNLIAQLSFTLIKTSTTLLGLLHRKRFLPMATEHYFRQVTVKSVLSAHRALSSMIS